MIKKKLTKLIGLRKIDFDAFVKSGQIKLQKSALIPVLKTGDEMALTSIFLSTVRLVKEYQDEIFKAIKLSRAGKAYFYTEVSFADFSKSRFDGLIIIVTKGVITDAAFFEMKNKNNQIDKTQIENYISLSKQLKVSKMITVSNQFVADKTYSPAKVKPSRNFSLLHFSWTYLLTQGRLLLFNNENSIEDNDQVSIMKEALYYFENKSSGISGYSKMNSGWKELVDSIRAQKTLKLGDKYIEEAILSWYEEERDMALLLSRKLGVLVKSSKKTDKSIVNDTKKLISDNYLLSELEIKNAVSSIKIQAEFERRLVSMSIKLIPPLNKGNRAKITWITKQFENFKKKNFDLFSKFEKDIIIEADIKYSKANLKVNLNDIESLLELGGDKDFQHFVIVLNRGFGASFGSTKKFIMLIEAMLLEYYEGIVQHAKSWQKPSPKVVENENVEF